MRKILIALAGVASLAASTAASAAVTIDFGPTTPIPGNNNFQGILSGLGLTHYATTGSSINLDATHTITFYFMGAESGFSDTFTTAGATPVSLNEAFNNYENYFGAPILIGSDTFAAGSLVNLLNFTSSSGAPGTVGTDPFGIFLGPNQISGSSVTEFYFGYDDQITNIDDNHDDFIIKAVITPAVPEPGTWAMMLIGFGAVGGAMRSARRRRMGDYVTA